MNKIFLIMEKIKQNLDFCLIATLLFAEHFGFLFFFLISIYLTLFLKPMMKSNLFNPKKPLINY